MSQIGEILCQHLEIIVWNDTIFIHIEQTVEGTHFSAPEFSFALEEMERNFDIANLNETKQLFCLTVSLRLDRSSSESESESESESDRYSRWCFVDLDFE